MTQMTCDECRQIIAVADLTDWNDMDGVAAHCRTCESCAGVVTDVRDSARRVADLLDGISPGVPAALVARRAAASAALERQERRRRRRFLYPIAGGAVLFAFAALGATRMVVPRGEKHHVVLQCLTPEQAATLVTPILGRDGTVAFSKDSPVRMLTLTGPMQVIGEASRVLSQLDNPASVLPGGSCVLPDHAMEEAHAMEQEVARAHQEAQRAEQEVERAKQEVERARQEAERARQEALVELDRQRQAAAAAARPDR